MANSKFSSFVYNVIDIAGFNDEIKSERIEAMEQLQSSVQHYLHTNDDIILTGSTSEGTLPEATSDLDLMSVPNNIICLDEDSSETDNLVEILVAQYEDTPPGYVKVRHNLRGSIDCHNIPTESYHFPQKSHWYGGSDRPPYLSNLDWKKQFDCRFSSSDIFTVNKQCNGPAHTFQYNVNCEHPGYGWLKYIGYVMLKDMDIVRAIRFYNSSILTGWSLRSRYHDWPSEELIHEVSTMEGFILPVGEKESETQHLEWRISHVTAEKALIKSFNSCQYKLYVILKLFSKQAFTSVSKSFSSYMIKNVVLWMTETNPSNHFTPDLLIAQLLQSLNLIKNCLICNHLPSYMIPSKNLIAGRIVGHEKRELISLLTALTDEGTCVIYRLPKLAKCLTYVSVHPDIFTRAGIRRHCIEKCMISITMRLQLTKISSEDLKPILSYIKNNSDVSQYRQLPELDICRLLFRDMQLLSEVLKLVQFIIPRRLWCKMNRVNLLESIKIACKETHLANQCFFLE